MIFYNASKQMALKELASDEERGLTEEQAAERLDEVGPNKLKEKRKRQICSGLQTSLKM